MTDATILTIGTVVAGFLATWWKDGRSRKWLREDQRAELAGIVERAEAEAVAARIHREMAAAQLRQDALLAAEKLSLDTRLLAARLREDQRKSADALGSKIDAVKIVAEGAFSEANSTHIKQQITNRQIEDLNKRLFTQGEQADAQGAKRLDRLKVIESGTGEIKDTVDRIEEKIQGA